MYTFITLVIVFFMLVMARYVSKNWINPSFILIIYWSFFIIAPFYAFRGDYDWKYIGLYWIIIACIFFLIGYLLGRDISNKKKQKISNIFETDSTKKLSKVSWIFIVILILIGMYRTVIEVSINGFSFSMFFNLDTLIMMNTSMAYDRYIGGGNSYNMIMQVINVFIYTAPLCGGYAYNYSEKKIHKILSVATFLPIIMSLLLTNGKVGLVANSFLWATGYLISYTEKYRKAPSINIRKVVIVLIVSFGVIGLLYISMLLRIGDLSSQTREIVNKKFSIYAFGHMQAFDLWFSNYGLSNEYTYGEYTFLGIFSSLGIAIRKQGVYDFIGGASSNIFTVFRGIIQDYGIMGGLLFMIILGLIGGHSFHNVLNINKSSVANKVILAATYFFIFHSMFSSAWTYTSYILLFPLFALYLLITKEGSKYVNK